jgi:hypothetical protein
MRRTLAAALASDYLTGNRLARSGVGKIEAVKAAPPQGTTVRMRGST